MLDFGFPAPRGSARAKAKPQALMVSDPQYQQRFKLPHLGSSPFPDVGERIDPFAIHKYFVVKMWACGAPCHPYLP